MGDIISVLEFTEDYNQLVDGIISLLEFTDYRLIFTGSIAGLAYFSIAKYSMKGGHSNLYNSRSKCGMGVAYLTTPYETMSQSQDQQHGHSHKQFLDGHSRK